MCADAEQVTADGKCLYKTPIEKHDPEFGVEHAEALRHLADGYRVQRENGAKLVVSVLAIRSVNGRCHSRHTGRLSGFQTLLFTTENRNFALNSGTQLGLQMATKMIQKDFSEVGFITLTHLHFVFFTSKQWNPNHRFTRGQIRNLSSTVLEFVRGKTDLTNLNQSIRYSRYQPLMV
jgi:hypothetical protein